MKNYEMENAPQFDEVHVELLSTAVAQAATALENASLFQQMQDALKAIENRERYQAGVARSAASLSELGTQSLGDVLRYLGQATQANRVYFIQYHEENQALETCRRLDFTPGGLSYSIAAKSTPSRWKPSLALIMATCARMVGLFRCRAAPRHLQPIFSKLRIYNPA